MREITQSGFFQHSQGAHDTGSFLSKPFISKFIVSYGGSGREWLAACLNPSVVKADGGIKQPWPREVVQCGLLTV